MASRQEHAARVILAVIAFTTAATLILGVWLTVTTTGPEDVAAVGRKASQVGACRDRAYAELDTARWHALFALLDNHLSPQERQVVIDSVTAAEHTHRTAITESFRDPDRFLDDC